jgi:hypothetical protein
MGYYSEVAFEIAFPDAQTAKEFLAVRRILNAEEVDELVISTSAGKKGTITAVYHAESIKWYDGFPEIRFYQQMLDDAEEAGYGIAFVRIGEEGGDIDNRYVDTDFYEAFDALHVSVWIEGAIDEGDSVQDFLQGEAK